MTEKLDDILHKFEEITMQLSEKDTAADPERFRVLMKERALLEPVVETYRAYRTCRDAISDSEMMLRDETDPEMCDMLKEEIGENKKRLPALEQELQFQLLPRDPDDGKSVIVEIRAGVGGDEAALFASDLYRLYTKYAEGKGWRVETTDFEEIGIGGLKTVSFLIEGTGVWSKLKYESGVHRVQRVPETESGGRIHTSTATVAVMPEAEEVEVEIDMNDCRFDVFRSSGHGGQSVNTTDSAVRLTHMPTGIVISCQDEKSQLKNKAKALKVLRARLYELEREKKHSEEDELRRSQIGTGDRSEKIRTYNFPQGRVTDHRIKLTLYKLDQVMEGSLDELTEALTRADRAARLAKMNEES
ncbi:MAG: peptide chain release factor 1 [Lachnospiraceae bacterium]|nr:peptide chain release factor 1 [Lachnospiraceae bacterium]